MRLYHAAEVPDWPTGIAPGGAVMTADGSAQHRVAGFQRVQHRPPLLPASSCSSVRGLHGAGLLAGRLLARSVEERGEDGVDLVGGQQGGAVAQAG